MRPAHNTKEPDLSDHPTDTSPVIKDTTTLMMVYNDFLAFKTSLESMSFKTSFGSIVHAHNKKSRETKSPPGTTVNPPLISRRNGQLIQHHHHIMKGVVEYNCNLCGDISKIGSTAFHCSHIYENLCN